MASAGGDGSAKPEAAEDVVDWKKLQTLSSEPQYPRKRRGKIRQIPDTYFLPRRSLPSALAFYGTFIVAGIGAGMLVEKWIQMKVAEMVTTWTQAVSEWHLSASGYKLNLLCHTFQLSINRRLYLGVGH